MEVRRNDCGITDGTHAIKVLEREYLSLVAMDAGSSIECSVNQGVVHKPNKKWVSCEWKVEEIVIRKMV